MRKKPVQKRSRVMVESLLEAAALTIVNRGLEATTTNHIAETAGVSIGSLYQYFESKEEIIEALLTQKIGDILKAVDQQQMALMDSDPRTITMGILESVFDVLENDACQRELARHWNSLRSRKAFRIMEQHMIEACRLYILRHHEEYRIDNLPAVLFVSINSLHYTVAHYLSQEKPMLSREEVIGALSDMLAAYLKAKAR